MFEKEFAIFWEDQVKYASGQRLEMLHRDLTGTKIHLREVLLPVLGTLEGLVLEYEMTSLSGVKIYGDVFHPKLWTVFEEDSFVTHAEKITRERFSFERARARSMGGLGYTFFPYSRDELEKKPSFCQRNLYELIGRVGSLPDTGLHQLPVYEREVLRCALFCDKPFELSDVSSWIQLKKEACGRIVRSLESKELLKPVGGGVTRCYKFMITDKAIALLHGKNRVW